MASPVTIEVYGLPGIRNYFNERELILAQLRALNRSVVTARKKAVAVTKSKFAAKSEETKRVIQIADATFDDLRASVWVGGKKKYASVHFQVRDLKRGGVSVKIYKKGTEKFKDAFTWQKSEKTYALRRVTAEKYPLTDVVKPKNIRLADVIRPEAKRIQEVFDEAFTKVLTQELQFRARRMRR